MVNTLPHKKKKTNQKQNPTQTKKALLVEFSYH